MFHLLHYLALYWDALVTLVYDMAPWLLLGFGIAGLLHVFLSDGKINKFLGDSSTKHVFRAAIFGIPLPLCSCGVIPTGISIYRGGASKGASIAFLISTPQTGVDSVMVTYSLLGLPFAILRPLVALVTGIFGGIVANLIERNQESQATLENQSGSEVGTPNEKPLPHEAGCCCLTCAAAKAVLSSHSPKSSWSRYFSWIPKLYEAARYAMIDFFGDIAKSLAVGLLIAALITVLVPNDFFASYIKSDLLGMLVVLVASIPLYVCATSSVPVAAVLIAKGLSPGAAIVFLMAGPATNAATITMIGSVMGRRVLFTYLGTIITGALLFGLLVDHLLPQAWFIPTIVAHAHDHGSLLPAWLQIASSVIFAAALAYAFFRRWGPKRRLASKKHETPEAEQTDEVSAEETIVLGIEGMICGHCKRTVEETVRELAGVEDAEADLASGTLAIRGTPDFAQVRQIIESLGFKVIEPENLV